MKILFVFLSMLLITSADAEIYSKIVGQVQIGGVDCHLVRINMYSDMGTPDPTDDIMIHSYLTVVGNDCDGLIPNPLIDNENQFYLNTVSDHIELTEIPYEINAYPNPCIDRVTIELSKAFLNLTEDQLVNVYLYDQNGTIISNIKSSVQSNSLILDTRNLQSGNYFVTIHSGKSFSTQIITKL